MLFRSKIAKSKEAKKFVDENAGVENLASKFAKRLVEATYKVTGSEFYVLSLCGDHNNPRVVENGLLSQWRAYGSGCGFAIVLNAKELEELAFHEFNEFDYVNAHMSDAIYGEEDEKYESEFLVIFEDFLVHADNILREAIYGEGDPTPEVKSAAFKAVHWCLTRFKHPGFSEENEVRIVVAPAVVSPEDIDQHNAQGLTVRPKKEIKFRPANGRPIPYIPLFGSPNKKLPIEKIIVGPGQDKNLTAEVIRKIVSNSNIEVTISDIPFV